MGTQSRNHISALVVGMVHVTLLVACAPAHEGSLSDSLSSFGTCEAELQKTFATTYHPFLRQQCGTCHISGGSGKGAFADQNMSLALSQFLSKTESVIKGKALDAAHQAPWTGPQNQSALNTFNSSFQTALTKYNGCQQSAQQPPNNPPPPPEPGQSVYFTVAKVMTANATAKTISFDLGTELAQPMGAMFAGSRIDIDVRTQSVAGGGTSYLFTNLRARAGTQALRYVRFEILINNQLISTATTYKGVDRRVPAQGQRTLSTTGSVIEMNVAATDTLSLGIGLIEAVNFAPPTYQQLIAATGVVGASCLNCHNNNNAAGGLNFNNYAQVISRMQAVPFNLAASEIYIRMNDAAAPMPTSGLLGAAQRKLVEDWIMDGAPNN